MITPYDYPLRALGWIVIISAPYSICSSGRCAYGLARSVDGSGYMIVIVIKNRRDGVGSSELLYYSLVFVCWSRLFCRLFRRRIALSRFVLVSLGVAELRKVDAGVLPRRWLRKLVRYRCVGHCTLFCRSDGGRGREEGKHSP